MDRQTLIQAMGNTYISDEEVAGFNAALIEAECTTVNRAAMFCAQVGVESASLRTYEEYASGAAYEWRADLGNIYAGDGVRYKGRSVIQVTGRHNYGECSKWAYSKGYVPTPTYFVDNPAELGTLKYCFVGAVWYWIAGRNMNSYADAGDIVGASYAVNGGDTGLQDRINRWNNCLSLGESILPSEGFLMALDNARQETVWSGAAQVNGASKTVRPAPEWLKRFLPKSFSDPNGVWVRDEIDAIVNEVVSGVFDIKTPIDFGDGPVQLIDVPPEQPVNFVTLLRVIAARQQAIRAQLNRIEGKL